MTNVAIHSDSNFRSSITAIIITFNEELHIERCLLRAKEIASRIVVIDSYSTDRTCEIARKLGADVYQHEFLNHADQFNWGVKKARITTDWVLRLDADEYLDDLGKIELNNALSECSPDVGAMTIRRGVVFRGKRIRYGGIERVRLTRIWRTGAASVEARWMDEQVLVHHGSTIDLPKGAIVDENLNDIGWWVAKHNGYTTRQMVQMILFELGKEEAINLEQLNAQVRRKRIARQRFYSPAPLFIRAFFYFIYRYIFALGFLDGKRGFLFHFFQGLWNFFLVDVKILEAKTAMKDGGYPAFKAWLATVYGIELKGK